MPEIVKLLCWLSHADSQKWDEDIVYATSNRGITCVRQFGLYLIHAQDI